MKALKITGIVIGSILVLVLIVVAIAWILLSHLGPIQRTGRPITGHKMEQL